MINLQQAIEKTFGTSHLIEYHERNTEPLVSIIIPTKNCLSFLPIAIRSIQNQYVMKLKL